MKRIWLGWMFVFAVLVAAQAVFPEWNWDTIGDIAQGIGMFAIIYAFISRLARIEAKMDRMQKEWEREIQVTQARLERLWD